MNLLDLIKKTHSPFYVIINNNQLITINESISVISVIDITDIEIEFNNTIIKDNNYLTTPIATTFEILKNSSDIFKKISDSYEDSVDYKIEDTVIKFNNNILNLVMTKFNNIARYDITYYIEDLKTQPIILDLLKCKAADGRFELKLHCNNKNYLLILFKGIIPLNKPDNISLSILENENDNISFYARFDIFKKKDKILIEQYINYIIV